MSLLILALLLGAPPAAPQGPPSSVEGMEPAPGVPSLLQSGVPAIPPELKSRTGQYLNARAASLADVSEDGDALLITTRFASTAQLHVVEMPLGMRTQITFGDEPVDEARFQPGDPQTVWYLQDSGGGEFYQLFRLDRRSGRSELLTDGKSRHQSLTLSRDGRRIAFSGTQRNGKDTDVYVAETGAPKNARRVTEAEGTWAPVEFSRDGARLLIVRERSIQDADLFALEVSSGKLTQLTPKEGKASVMAARWTSDGKGVYLVTDRWSDFNQFYQLDAQGKHTPQLAAVSQIARRGMRGVRWPGSGVGGLDPSPFVDAQLVRSPAGAGGAETMPAFLYKPRGANGKLPVVIIWHGGPESQSRPTFSSFVQLLASELRLAVLLPNVRGSAGYGKAYLAADDGVKREQAPQDITATLDFIARQPELDASRIGVYGGSYGGYMTLVTAAFQGRRVRAAVDVVGISNLVTFLQNTQAYRRDLRRAEYGDERDPAVRAVQERISPLLSVDKIEAELFVQQGYNDPRVPRSEAERIVKAVPRRR